jgi:probable rRNA maturation factor
LTFTIEEEVTAQFPFDYKKVARQVVEAAMDYEQFPYEAEVHLLLVDDTLIQEINREQRQIDAPTDVLSFPMIDYEKAGDFSALEQQQDIFNPETGEALLGDIVISTDRVYAQAKEFGHTPKREFAFLIAHSMLHLMGYDHMLPEEAEEMEQRQEAILQKLNITRE